MRTPSPLEARTSRKRSSSTRSGPRQRRLPARWGPICFSSTGTGSHKVGHRVSIPAALGHRLQNACAVHQRDGHPSASKTATGSR